MMLFFKTFINIYYIFLFYNFKNPLKNSQKINKNTCDTDLMKVWIQISDGLNGCELCGRQVSHIYPRYSVQILCPNISITSSNTSFKHPRTSTQ